MRKVMIVEDESYICELICHLVDWIELDLSLSTVATNGIDALNLAIQDHPDIVITDISIPDISGLELIQKIRENGLDPKFIIITGHDTMDFSYAAIRLGVKQFLLKPINKNQINEALHEICSVPSESVHITQTRSNPNTLLPRQLLYDLAHQELAADIPNLAALGVRYAIPLTGKPVNVGTIWLNNSSLPSEFTRSMLQKLAKHFHTILRPVCHTMEVIEQDARLVFLIELEECDMNIYYPIFSHTADIIIAPYPFLRFVVGLGEAAHTPGELQNSWKTSNAAVSSRILYGFNRVIHAGKEAMSDSNVMLPSCNFIWEDIWVALAIPDTERLKSAITQLCKKHDKYFSVNPALIIDWYKETANMLFGKFSDIFKQYDHLTKEALATTNKNFEECESLTSLTECLQNDLLEIIDKIIKEKHTDEKIVIHNAKNYIRNHFARPIKLEDAAQQVHLDPTHFKTLFNNETGFTFTEFLITVRMGMAADMLLNSSYALSNISELVGYVNHKDFSRLFKEYYGISPSQYRKLHQK